MVLAIGRITCAVATWIVLAFLSTPVFALEHVVSLTELQKQVANESSARQHKVESLQKSFADAEVQQALKVASIDPAEVRNAVALLSDEELAKLSSRANQAQQDFAAGSTKGTVLLTILLSLALVLILTVVWKE